MTTTIYTQTTSFSADSVTPVGLYLSLRDKHRSPCLLESNDYHSRANSKSFIGLDPLVTITLTNDKITVEQNEKSTSQNFQCAAEGLKLLHQILENYSFSSPDSRNGFLSYFSFEYAQLVEDKIPEKNAENLPLAQFIFFETLLVLDHFRDTGIVFKNSLTPEIKKINLNDLLRNRAVGNLPFTLTRSETSTQTDSNFLELVNSALLQIYRGNVFQLVVSRRFEQTFFGDDFEVYRTLRRLNPSPYLFYLDLEHARLFGSSPETQIALQNGQAEIHPIAGTIRKTGDEAEDKRLVLQLQQDEKENAEHTMLVDLARNDLSKYSNQVRVVSYKEVQHFSHVIHLVSKVIAKTSAAALDLFNGTFPAGTLSGTPKPKAIELIDQLEPHSRGFYGGAIGFISSTGDANLAIIIRSVLSKNNCLYYQAGAGVVLDSLPENELNEVNSKLGAIRSSIHQTQQETV